MSSSTSKPRELTVSEIAAEMVACRSNARELLGKVGILLGAGRRARAYMLLHTACEELAKCFMFEIVGRRVAQGNPQRWRRFWQRVRNHDSKIAQVEARLRFILGARDPEPCADSVLAGLDMLLSGGLIPRNASLYVEPSPDGSFRKLPDIDWDVGLTALRATAERLLRGADEIGSSLEAIETALHEPADAWSEAVAVDVLRLGLIRFRDMGKSKDEASRFIEKAYGASS